MLAKTILRGLELSKKWLSFGQITPIKQKTILTRTNQIKSFKIPN